MNSRKGGAKRTHVRTRLDTARGSPFFSSSPPCGTWSPGDGVRYGFPRYYNRPERSDVMVAECDGTCRVRTLE